MVALACALSACSSDLAVPAAYKTKNVVIFVIDGPRYSETWGDATRQHIPHMHNDLAPHGVVSTAFYTDVPTWTNPGHAALTTGRPQNIDNSGQLLPADPGIFQLWMEAHKTSAHSAYLITSKDKLQVLANCSDSAWYGKYNPATNCGVGGQGVGSGYRSDSQTMFEAIHILKTYHPRLIMISLREPDYSGHSGDWNAYLQGIKDSDEHLFTVWQFLQSDPFYKDVTTLFVTNDHGRHLDGTADGFISHGDNCEGCRHINLFASGPDFKKGKIVNTLRSLVDISETIAELMKFKIPNSTGKVMRELFEN